jgi:hypothetical protein
MRRILALVFVLVLAGCAAPVADQPSGDIGTVGNVTAHEQIAVTTADGLNETELDLLVKRAMARVELIRERNFTGVPDVEIQSRAEFRESVPSFGDESPDHENLVWEALFVVGEDRDVTEVFDSALATGVQGYYSPDDDRVVVVNDEGLSVETLVHELVHALQDQQLTLGSGADTRDAEFGQDGVVEGEATLVASEYMDRCGVAWSCVTSTEEEGTTDLNLGIRLVLGYPYTQGPEFVETIRDRGGWDAVDDLHEQFPASSEQVTHPDRYPDDRPANVTVSDRSTAEWTRLDSRDTLGETSVYAMLVHSRTVDVETVEAYDHQFSEGWAGDTFRGYENDAGEFGYVWETEWESQTDAEQFHHAYEELLSANGAADRGRNVFVVPEGSFADAFRVTREGTTVRVVNAPTADALAAVHGT